MKQFIGNAKFRLLLNYKVSPLSGKIVKDIWINPCLCWPCLIKHKTSGNNDREIKNTPTENADNKKPGKDTFRPRLRKQLSPSARLAGILPNEYQVKSLLTKENMENHKDNRDNYEGSLRKSTNYDDQSMSRNKSGIIEKRLNFFRGKRSLSPLQRLSDQIPEEFWSSENKEMKNSVYTLREVDTHVETQIGLANKSSSWLNEDIPESEEQFNTPVTQKFQFGCFVTLCSSGWPKGQKRYIFRLEKGRTFRLKSYGSLHHNDIERKSVGQLLRVSSSKNFIISHSTLEDYVTLMPRNTSTANPKTVNKMINMADIHEGCRVLEAGTGSGAATLLLSRAVGLTGHVISVEKCPSYTEITKETVSKWQDHCRKLGYVHHPNITYMQGDITVPQTLEDIGNWASCDAVFLDMKNPSDALSVVVKFVKPGKAIMVYCPSISTVLSCVKQIHDSVLDMKVHGVYEDTEKVWKLEHHLDLKHESDLAGTTCRPYQCDEAKTVFILHLIKFEPASKDNVRMDETKHGELTSLHDGRSSKIFMYGDHILLEYLHLRKKGKELRCLRKLTESGKFPLREGHLKHSDVVGVRQGSILSVGHLPPLTVKRPTLNDYVCSTLHENNDCCQLFSCISHFLDVKKGDTIFHIGRDNKTCTAYALHLSQAVGEEGNVYCLTGSEADVSECEKYFCTWRGIYSQNTGDVCPHNIHFGVLHGPATSNGNFTNPSSLSPLQFEGVSTDVPLPILISQLPYITARLKSGHRLLVMFSSLTPVLELFHWIKKSSLPLSIASVQEETERQWTVQPAKLSNLTDVYHKDNWPYICRPKQNIRKKAGFIVNIIKAWKMQ